MFIAWASMLNTTLRTTHSFQLKNKNKTKKNLLDTFLGLQYSQSCLYNGTCTFYVTSYEAYNNYVVPARLSTLNKGGDGKVTQIRDIKGREMGRGG